MSLVLVGILAYVLAQLALGVVVSRRIHSEADYLVAGRSLGYGLATFTIFATWFGAESGIGAAGAAYRNGLSGARADPFGYGLCLLLMGLVFAVPLWRRGLTTLGDFFRQRYGQGVERLAVVLMVPTSVLWAAAQVRAFGQVLSASSGLDLSLMVTLAAAIVITYTMLGGLLADAWTDLIQGIALLVGMVVLWAGVVRAQGGTLLAQLTAPRLAAEPAPLLETVEAWAIPICGSVLAAELVSRVIAARSPEVARRSSLLAGGMYLLFGLIPVSLGMAGAALLPGLAEPEQVLPLLAQRFLPTALYVLFAGALVSAILSTVDSALLAAGSLLSHNLVAPLFPQMDDRGRLRAARVSVAGFGACAYVLALHAEGVYALVEEASAFGSAGIFTVIVLGLFTRFGESSSAAASLLAGVATWIVGAHLSPVAYPYLTSLAVALAAYLVVGLLARRPAWTPAPYPSPEIR